MIVLDSLFEKKDLEEKVVALGNFDGFHIGHMELIKKCIVISERENYKSLVLSFKNNPLNFIQKSDFNKALMSSQDKIDLLNSKINYLLLIDFDEKIADIKAECFMKLLKENFNVKAIVTGFNFRFGYKNLGNNNLMEDFCNNNNIKLYIVPPVRYDNQIVNSTYIRELITNKGNIKLANKLLGRKFSIGGLVAAGKSLGRTIGTPTANLKFDSHMIVPLNGVYFTESYIEGKLYKSLTNVGYNVTVTDDKFIKIETHILNFNGDIYGKPIKIYFLDRIRDELKFNNINELKKQIEIDINYIYKTFYN